MTDQNPTPTTQQPPTRGRRDKGIVILLAAVLAAIVTFFAFQFVSSVVTFTESLSSPTLIGGVDTIGWGASIAFWGMILSSFARGIIRQRGSSAKTRAASLAVISLAFASFVASLAAIPGSDSSQTFTHVVTATMTAAFVIWEFAAELVPFAKRMRARRTGETKSASTTQVP